MPGALFIPARQAFKAFFIFCTLDLYFDQSKKSMIPSC